MDVSKIIGGIVCAVLAVGMFTYARHLYVSSKGFRDRAELVTGRITKIEKKSAPDGSGTLYCPVVQYITKDGETFMHASSVCSYPASYKVGDSVEIYYDPIDPIIFEINDFWSKWLPVIVTGGLGVWGA